MLHQNQPNETTGLLHQDRKQVNLSLKRAVGTTSSSLTLQLHDCIPLASIFLLSAHRDSSCYKMHIWGKQMLFSV